MLYCFNGLYQEPSSEMFLFFCITLTVFYYFNGLYQEPLSEMSLFFCITLTAFNYCITYCVITYQSTNLLYYRKTVI